MNTKRLLALLLTLCMVFSLAVPGVAFAEDEETALLVEEGTPAETQDENPVIEEQPEETTQTPVVEEIIEENGQPAETVIDENEQPAENPDETQTPEQPDENGQPALASLEAQEVTLLGMGGGAVASLEARDDASLGEGTAVASVTVGNETKEYTNLHEALNAALNTDGVTSATITLLTDITYEENAEWSPVVFQQAHTLVFNGDNKTITNLPGMMFNKEGSGGHHLVMSNVTFQNPKAIVSGDYAAVIMGYADCVNELNFTNVHIKNATVQSNKYAGAFYGFGAGYNNQNDGPVFAEYTFTNCSVTNSSITGKGSTGALIGHAAGSAWTHVTITDTEVKGNTITGGDAEHTGILIGTIGAAKSDQGRDGGVWIKATESGNSLTYGQYEIGRIATGGGTCYFTAGGSYTVNPILTSDPTTGTIAAEDGYEVVYRGGVYTIGTESVEPEPTVTVDEDGNVTATIPTGVFDGESAQGVTIAPATSTGSVISVTFDADAAATIATNAGKSTVTLKVEDKTEAGATNTKTFEITMVTMVEGQEVGVFSGANVQGTATVTVPFDVTEGAYPEVFLLTNNGQTRTPVTVIGYTSTSVTFEVSHFSEYQIENVTIDWTQTNITINTADELAAFAAQVNGGNNFANQTVTLGADITLNSTESWTPIGGGTRKGAGNYFAGTFDGAGHTVSGLMINTSAGNDNAVGLFGLVKGGTVTNFTMTGVSVSLGSDQYGVGSAVGVLYGSGVVSKVSVTGGSVTGGMGVGGVVGMVINGGTVSECINAATVRAITYNAGGVIGAAYYHNAGTYITVSNCANTGSVSSDGSVTGGIVGLSCANVSECTNSGAITVGSTNVGGIVGEQQNYGSISSCTNSGAITNNGNNYGAGGIVGWIRYNGNNSAYTEKLRISVTDNTNTASVNGGNDAGGIVGTVYHSAYISGNTNEAASLSGTTYAAGIVGNYQITDDLVPTDYPNELIVTGNTSKTEAANITANCKGLIIYDNTSGSALLSKNNPSSQDNVFEAQIGTGANAVKYGTLEAAFAAAQDGDTVTLLQDVNVETVAINGGVNVTIDLNQKTLTTDFMYVLNGKATISNGNVTSTDNGDGYFMYVYSSADSAAAADYSKLTIASTATVNGDVVLWGNNNDASKGYGAKIDIAGKVNGCVFVSGNITEGNDEINVTGEINTDEDIGIALNGNATLNIETGANIHAQQSVENATGVEVRAGKLNMTGGTVTGKGEYTVVSNGNGTTSTGAGIAVVQHTTKLPIEATLSGGTVTASDPSKALTVAAVEEGTNMAVVKVTATGEFVESQTEVPNGYKWQETATAGTYELVPFDAVAMIGETKYETLAAAIDAIKASESKTGTIVLQKDVTEEVAFNGGMDITLDLNGKTLTTDFLYVLNGKATVQNGTVTSAENGDGYFMYVYSTDDSTKAAGEYSKLTIANDAVVNGDVVLWGKYGDASKGYGAQIDIAGKVNGCVFVSGNITEGNDVVNVSGEVATDEDVGIALNGNATLNIQAGANIHAQQSVEKATGVEVRAGKLNMTGGTVTGKGEYTVTSNGNGTTSTGAGIAIVQHTTKLPVNTSLTGGTVTATDTTKAITVAAVEEGTNMAIVNVTADENFVKNQDVVPAGYAWQESDNDPGTFVLAPVNPTATINFLGGGLQRRVYTGTSTVVDFETNIRLGFQFELPENAVIDTNNSYFRWKLNSPASADSGNRIDIKNIDYEYSIGKPVAHMIVTGVPKAYYTADFYCFVHLVYSINGVNYVLESGGNGEYSRSVQGVCNGLIANPGTGAVWKEYAQRLLNVITESN